MAEYPGLRKIQKRFVLHWGSMHRSHPESFQGTAIGGRRYPSSLDPPAVVPFLLQRQSPRQKILKGQKTSLCPQIERIQPIVVEKPWSVQCAWTLQISVSQKLDCSAHLEVGPKWDLYPSRSFSLHPTSSSEAPPPEVSQPPSTVSSAVQGSMEHFMFKS